MTDGAHDQILPLVNGGIAHSGEPMTSLATRHWQALFDALSDGICLVDQDGTVVQCNRPMTDVFSQPVRQIQGHSYRELVRELLSTDQLPDFEPIAEPQGRKSLELCAGQRWFRLAVRGIDDERGRTGYALHVWTDVTEHKLTEEVE